MLNERPKQKSYLHYDYCWQIFIQLDKDWKEIATMKWIHLVEGIWETTLFPVVKVVYATLPALGFSLNEFPATGACGESSPPLVCTTAMSAMSSSTATCDRQRLVGSTGAVQGVKANASAF